MKSIINWLGNKPFLGSITSFSTLLTVDNLELILKFGLLSTGIVQGVLTIYGWFEKRKNERP